MADIVPGIPDGTKAIVAAASAANSIPALRDQVVALLAIIKDHEKRIRKLEGRDT